MVLFAKTWTILREENVGTYVNGIYVSGERTPINILADAQTLSGKEIESLNIGRDNVAKIKIFSDYDLIFAEAGTDGTNLRNGDYFVYTDGNYEIIKKDIYGNLITHFEYIAEIREEEE